MITSIVDNYLSLQSNVDNLIKASGYRIEFVANEMGMDRTSFYLKRKKKNFTPQEIKSFLTVIRADELEDKILAQLSVEDQKDGIISETEKRVLLDAR